MSERTRRVGENEALFRTVNDEVHGLSSAFAVSSDPMSVVCECGRPDCTEKLELSAGEYEDVRRESTHFVIKPGHELADVESVVVRHERYWVVEKRDGEAAKIARITDPRD